MHKCRYSQNVAFNWLTIDSDDIWMSILHKWTFPDDPNKSANIPGLIWCEWSIAMNLIQIPNCSAHPRRQNTANLYRLHTHQKYWNHDRTARSIETAIKQSADVSWWHWSNDIVNLQSISPKSHFLSTCKNDINGESKSSKKSATAEIVRKSFLQ